MTMRIPDVVKVPTAPHKSVKSNKKSGFLNSPFIKKYLRAFVIGAIPTVVGSCFLSNNITGKVQWDWVGTGSFYVGVVCVGLKSLDNEPPTSEAILKLNRTIEEKESKEEDLKLQMELLVNSLDSTSQGYSNLREGSNALRASAVAIKKLSSGLSSDMHELSQLIRPLVDNMNSTNYTDTNNRQYTAPASTANVSYQAVEATASPKARVSDNGNCGSTSDIPDYLKADEYTYADDNPEKADYWG